MCVFIIVARYFQSAFHISASYIREARAGSTVLRFAKIRNYRDRNTDLADLTDFRGFFYCTGCFNCRMGHQAP